MAGFKLILGTPVNGVPKPWDNIAVQGVMVNGYELLASGKLHDLRGRGLRRELGISDDVELWIDSGGYQFIKRNVQVTAYKLARLYREIDADYYVSLDYPPSPGDTPEIRALKIARTISNFIEMRRWLRGIVEEGRLVPVFHIAVGEALRLQMNVYMSHALTAAVGGLIPYLMQRHGKGSRLKALLFMALVKKLWDGRVHAMGLASAAMIPILKALGIDSGDTQTWRLKAAFGKVVIPGIGERHVSGRKVSFGPAVLKDEEREVFTKYVEMAAEKLGISVNDMKSRFEARALFNAWVISLVASNGHGYTGPSKAFHNLYKLALKLRQKSAEEIESMLFDVMSNDLPNEVDSVEGKVVERRLTLQEVSVPGAAGQGDVAAT